MKYSILALTLLTFGLAFPLYADDAQQKMELNDSQKSACADNEEGDLCQFTNDSGDAISGQCKRNGSADNSLTCVPNG
jgi:hypothetical protein